jgi:hypothetical protein
MTAAVNADMVPRSPCREVRLPKVEREEMRFLNPAEVARLADLIDARYRALVLVAAYGGLRIGELAGGLGVHRRQGRGPAAIQLPGQGLAAGIRAAGLAPLRPHDLWMPREQEWCFACSGPDDYRLEVKDGTTSGPEVG